MSSVEITDTDASGNHAWEGPERKGQRGRDDPQEDFGALDELIGRAGKRAERIPPSDIFRMARLMRRNSARLAVMRRLHGPIADPEIGRLERRVVRARSALSGRSSRRTSFLSFFSEEYWRLIADRSGPLGIATAALFVPAVAGVWWASRSPEAVTSFLPPEFLWVTDAASTDIGASPVGLAGFSLSVMTNNIRVTLLTFVLGVTWGLGTGWILFQNGLILGAITGLAIGAGNSEVLVEALAAHGVLELSCIVVGGAAGLAVGRSMLRPGPLTRREALVAESRNAVKIAIGTAPWLVVAGIVEGYASRVGLDILPSSMIGVFLGGLYWWLVWRLGTRRTEIPHSGLDGRV